VSPDLMDSSVVVSMSSWILAELIRIFHGVSTNEAQKLVDNLVERRLPLVWKSGSIRRVLSPDMSLKDQILLLISSCPLRANVDDLFSWSGYDKRGYFNRIIKQLHGKRFIEFYETEGDVELLPPGAEHVSVILSKIK